MERGKIIIRNNTVHLRLSHGTVWMSQHQIADLFNVFVSKIGSNIRSIFKNKLLREEDVTFTHYFDGGSVTLYNLEMITILAYRIQSAEADVFRKWTSRKQTMQCSPPGDEIMIYFSSSKKNLC